MGVVYLELDVPVV